MHHDAGGQRRALTFYFPGARGKLSQRIQNDIIKLCLSNPTLQGAIEGEA